MASFSKFKEGVAKEKVPHLQYQVCIKTFSHHNNNNNNNNNNNINNNNNNNNNNNIFYVQLYVTGQNFLTYR